MWKVFKKNAFRSITNVLIILYIILLCVLVWYNGWI